METPRFEADYYDGRTAARHRVQVEVDGDAVRVRGATVSLDLAAGDLHVQPRVGRLPLRIVLPDGALLLADADGVSKALPIPRARGLAHRLESHLGAVAASIVGLIATLWFGYAYGIPWAARTIASHLPPSMEANIAVEGMKALDSYVFKPSELPDERKAALRKVFAGLAAKSEGSDRDARLEFRDGGFIGANAFALPGGLVVLTDQLAVSMPDDELVAAVLAHELGHLRHRHGTRHILQDSIVGLVALAIYGDATAVTTIAVTAPTTLLHNGYSRDFEREADQYAYGLMRATGRSPRLLGTALAELEQLRETEGGSCPAPKDDKAAEDPPAKAEAKAPPRKGRGDWSYISTHPGTEERIRAAEEAAR